MIGNLKRRRFGAAAGVALLGLPVNGAVLVRGSAEARAVSAPPAHVARTLKATDTAKLHKVSALGSELFEEGKATGTLPGRMHANVNIGATISGSFIIYTSAGAIRGHGEAKLKLGSGVYESFAGTVTVKGGTGRFAHARGRTGLYGTFDRETYALVIQTTGALSY